LERKKELLVLLTVWWDSLERWDGKTDPPMLSLESAEAYSFPSQGKEGWRLCGRLRITNIIGKDDEETAHTAKGKDMVTPFYKDKKRGKKYHYPIFKCEYITVRDTATKDLPLLVGTLKEEGAMHLFEQRLIRKELPHENN